MNKTLLQKYLDIMPAGAGGLFFIQIFATMSLSVLYSSLVLYLTNDLNISDTTATAVTASFVAFNYTLHLIGGYVGGRFFSYRSLLTIGMIAQIFGCLLISVPAEHTLYWGMAAFLTGSGISFTCINCMVTQLFKPNDARRESAFLWNYSGMNIGFFVGYALSGYFQLKNAYHELFVLSCLGNFCALLITIYKWKSLKDIYTTISVLNSSAQWHKRYIGIALIIVIFLSLRILLEHAHGSNQLIMCLGAFMAAVIIVLAKQQPSSEATKKMWAYLILACTALTFWTLYQLAPMGLMLFIERNVDRHLFGMIIPPQWFQNINTVVIILGGPLLSVAFNHLRKKGFQISIPLQFSLALTFIGIAFAILPIGIFFANSQGYCEFGWILLSFILQSLGELFIAPIGYAMIGNLAPRKLQGLMMGTWMMITGVAATLSAQFSKMALGVSHSKDPLLTNASYSHTFAILGGTSICVGIALFMVLPLILRLTQQTKIQPTLETVLT